MRKGDSILWEWNSLYIRDNSLHMDLDVIAIVNKFTKTRFTCQLHSLGVIRMGLFAFKTLNKETFKCKCIAILFWNLALNVGSQISRGIRFIWLLKKMFVIFTLSKFLLIVDFSATLWVKFRAYKINGVCWFLSKTSMFTQSKTCFITQMNKLFIWLSNRKLSQ